jgi:hypothetical protein
MGSAVKNYVVSICTYNYSLAVFGRSADRIIVTTFPVIAMAASFAASGCHSNLDQHSDTPFRIIATDAGFDAPDTVSAGVRHIVFENHGSEIHEAMLVKLPQGMTVDEYIAAVRSGSLFPAGALDHSGPGLTSPGETVEVWVNLDPGQYILICWNDGHARSTPPHPFTVEYAISDNAPPKEDVVVKLIDYRFDFVGRLRKGVKVIRAEMTGPSMHEMDIFRLHDGKSVADVRRWRKGNGHGLAPVEAMGGVLDSHDIRRVVWLRRNFSAGRYVLHCEVPLVTNAEPTNQEITHADLGMVREFEIAE